MEVQDIVRVAEGPVPEISWLPNGTLTVGKVQLSSEHSAAIQEARTAVRGTDEDVCAKHLDSLALLAFMRAVTSQQTAPWREQLLRSTVRCRESFLWGATSISTWRPRQIDLPGG